MAVYLCSIKKIRFTSRSRSSQRSTTNLHMNWTWHERNIPIYMPLSYSYCVRKQASHILYIHWTWCFLSSVLTASIKSRHITGIFCVSVHCICPSIHSTIDATRLPNSPNFTNQTLLVRRCWKWKSTRNWKRRRSPHRFRSTSLTETTLATFVNRLFQIAPARTRAANPIRRASRIGQQAAVTQTVYIVFITNEISETWNFMELLTQIYRKSFIYTHIYTHKHTYNI